MYKKYGNIMYKIPKIEKAIEAEEKGIAFAPALPGALCPTPSCGV